MAINFWEVLHGSKALKQIKETHLHIETYSLLKLFFFYCGTLETNIETLILTLDSVRNGGWTPWSSWGQCSTSCEIGFEVRQRSCNNPSPRHGGRVCVGQAREQRWETEKVECSRPLRYALICIQSGEYSKAGEHWCNKTFYILYFWFHNTCDVTVYRTLI